MVPEDEDDKEAPSLALACDGDRDFLRVLLPFVPEGTFPTMAATAAAAFSCAAAAAAAAFAVLVFFLVLTFWGFLGAYIALWVSAVC